MIIETVALKSSLVSLSHGNFVALLKTTKEEKWVIIMIVFQPMFILSWCLTNCSKVRNRFCQQKKEDFLLYTTFSAWGDDLRLAFTFAPVNSSTLG